METAISQNLKKYRKINHLTQQEMASQLFVTPQAVSKWERGESMPDISLVPQIADLFDISIASLWETLPEKSETEDFDELLTQLTDMASIRELISHFDFFTFLTKEEKEVFMMKLLEVEGTDILIEDIYFYLSQTLKEVVITTLLKTKSYQGLEQLIPMMSKEIRSKVLVHTLEEKNMSFLEELLPFLTHSQKQSLIDVCLCQGPFIEEIDAFLPFFTKEQQIALQSIEED